MESKNVLVLFFLSIEEKPKVNRLEFNGNLYDVKVDTFKTIDIPENFYDENETKTSSIKLFEDKKLINECIFDIFIGYNFFYCFLDDEGYTIQLLFKEITPTINISLYKDKVFNISNYDTNQTLDRKRFSLLNINRFPISINNKKFNIAKFVTKLGSYQISFYNLEKMIAVTKPLSLEREDTFYQSYIKYKSLSCSFKDEMTNLLKNPPENIKNNLLKYKKLNKIEFFLNTSKTILEKMFTNEEYIEFYANFSLYKIIKKIKDISSVKQVFNLFNEKIEEIKKNKTMKIYQKISLIEHFKNFCLICKTKNNIKKAKFTYYLMEDKEKGSILDLVEKFFKEYRDKLTEKSPVFEKLIELDGSPGVFKKRRYYCFNMQNINELKKHLLDIETSIFVTHDMKNNGVAYTNIRSGIVSVNTHNIKGFKNLVISLNKKLPKNKIELGNSIASKIIYYLLHEINGHKKFSFNKKKFVNSPTMFIENGKIYALCRRDSNLKGKNKIKIVPRKNIGEDGYFYELCYGKIKDYYTFEILDQLIDFSDLLAEVDLWVNKLDMLKEYVKYKFCIQCYGSHFKSNKSTIEDKIKDYKNECLRLQNEKKIYIDTFFTIPKEQKHKKKKVNDNTRKNKENEEVNKKKELYNEDNFRLWPENKIIIKMNEINNVCKDENKVKNEDGGKNNIEKEVERKEEEIEEVEGEEGGDGEFEGEDEEEDEFEGEEEEEEEDEEEEEKEGEGEGEGEGMHDYDKEIKKSIKGKFNVKKFMRMSYEKLLKIEKSGILTEEQTELIRERRELLLNCPRYIPSINEDI